MSIPNHFISTNLHNYCDSSADHIKINPFFAKAIALKLIEMNFNSIFAKGSLDGAETTNWDRIGSENGRIPE
jgi:hypothetical protein